MTLTYCQEIFEIITATDCGEFTTVYRQIQEPKTEYVDILTAELNLVYRDITSYTGLVNKNVGLSR